MRPTLFAIALCIATIFVLSACQKERDVVDLSEQVKASIPYKNGQHLKFRNDTGHVHECIVEKIAAKNSGTNRDVWVYQYLVRDGGRIDYPVVTLTLIARGEGPAEVQASDATPEVMQMSLAHHFSNVNSFGSSYNLYLGSDAAYRCDSVNICHGSIEIDGRRHENVTELRRNEATIFYSREKGLLHWEFNDGRSFTLVE